MTKKDFDKIKAQIEGKFGSFPDTDIMDWVSTGSVPLNAAIGKPGLPVGKLSSINGPPSGGKTTLIGHILRETQLAGGIAALVETEYSYDPDRFAAIGVNLDDLIKFQPESVEDAFIQIHETIDMFRAKDKKVGITIAWDTVSATPMRSELEADPTATGAVGAHARYFSRQFRKTMGKISKENVCLVFVNQLKADINMYGGGASKTHLAYAPIRFHSSVVLDVRQKEWIKKGSEVIGIKSAVRVSKNKVAPPFKKVIIDIMFSNGIDNISNLLDLAVKEGLVKLSGKAWYSLNDKKFRRNEFQKILDENVRLRAVLDQKMYEVF